MMESLVAKILRGIPDDDKLSSFINMPSPIRDLIEGYNKVAISHHVASLVTGDTTGINFKKNIECIEAVDQVHLLAAYIRAVQHIDEPTVYCEPIIERRRQEAPAAPHSEEERTILEFKSFTARTLVVLTAALIFTITGITFYYSQKDDKEAGTVVDTIVATTKDIVKFILGMK